MLKRLVIVSGLPGTGKSALAFALAQELQWPLLCIDDLIGEMPDKVDLSFWDGRISILLDVIERQLEVGLNVIVDSVFMNTDRHHVRDLALRYKYDFAPIYVFVSDEQLWERRVTDRFQKSTVTGVATWERIQQQRKGFRTWEPNTALFIDSIHPLSQNVQTALDFVTTDEIELTPMSDVALIPGRYHN